MNWEAIGAVSEIVGALSVLATLLYLALQIRQSNRIAFVTTEVEIRNNFSAMNEALMGNSDVIALLARLEDENVELSREDLLRAELWWNRLLNGWIAAETAFDNGMLPQGSYDVVLNDIKAVIARFPGARPLFHNALKTFPALATYNVFTYIGEQLEINEH